MLASDMCRGWDPVAAVRWSIAQNEHSLAADLLDLMDLEHLEPAETVADLRSKCEASYSEAIETIKSRQHRLKAMCEKAGIPQPMMLLSGASTDQRFDRAMHELDEVEAEIDATAAAVSLDLRQALGSRAAAMSEQSRRYLEEAIELGELRVAKLQLSCNEQASQRLVPHAIADRPWRWTTYSLQRILHNLSTPIDRPPGMSQFVPRENDHAGHRLLAALSTVASQLPHVTESTAQEYVTAVQQLIAPIDMPSPIYCDGDIFFSELAFPVDPRLPRLKITQNPIRLAIGTEPGGANVRLSYEVDDRRRNHATIDVAAVLSLLARDENGDTQEKDTRAMSILRTICTQLDFADVIDYAELRNADEQRFRLQLWWLLNLIDSKIQAPKLDSLIEVSGGHALPLWRMLRWEAARTRRTQSPFTLDALVQSPGFDKLMCDSVAAEIYDDAAAAVLDLVVWGSDTEATLNETIVLLLTEQGSDAQVNTIIDLDAAIDRLSSLKYIVSTSAGVITTCECGTVRALRRADPWARASLAISRLLERHTSDSDSVAEDVLTRLVVDATLHQLGVVLDPNEDLRSNASVNRIVRRSKEDWLGKQAFDLCGECDDIWRKNRDMARGVTVLFKKTADVDGVRVFGPPVALRALLEALLTNAVRAALENRPANSATTGTVALIISLNSPAMSVMIDITDSGAGVAHHVRLSLAERKKPMSTAHAGEGTGLWLARKFAQFLDGSIDLLDAQGLYGGATFRVTLPIIAGPN
jgi:signal transduction histidine kinase